VKPALGCTGPVAVALATAAARDAVGGTPQKIKVLMDKDTYVKNSAVGIPGLDIRGINACAAIGAIAGVSKYGLEVLKNVTQGDAEKVKTFLSKTQIEIKWDFTGIGLFIEAWVETDEGEGHALLEKTHSNIVFTESNGKLLKGRYPKDFDEEIDHSRDPIRRFSVENLRSFALKEPLENLLFLKEAAKMNLDLAKKGLSEGVGENFGNSFNRIPDDSGVMRAKIMAASAADARMSGKNFPAMSCATSGNVGITASVPLIVMAQELKVSEEVVLRALALSFLMTIQIKSYIGRYSPFCACAIASSIGIAGGMVLLLGGTGKQTDDAIRSVIGSTLGVLCDGAKHGCALKLAVASGAAIECAFLAMQGSSIQGGDGVVCVTADETIKMMGKMAREGMSEADQTMCRLIYERDQQDLPK
jgi:L-cysteine desulfidase